MVKLNLFADITKNTAEERKLKTQSVSRLFILK